MDLLTSIILWGFVGILFIGWSYGLYYAEFKHHCKTYKSLEKNLNAKFHGDFRKIKSKDSSYVDSGFRIYYDYCQVYYCLQCGIISHWDKGRMSLENYLKIIKDEPDKEEIIEKLNKYIQLANQKYKLNQKLL